LFPFRVTNVFSPSFVTETSKIQEGSPLNPEGGMDSTSVMYWEIKEEEISETRTVLNSLEVLTPT